MDRNGIYKEVHQKAIADPHAFVMKPQREGGGTLITGDEIPHALKTWNDDELLSHILMDRINPIATPNVLLLNGMLSPLVDVISELGVYHAYLADESTTLIDITQGYLLRTKPANVEDGGVASGRAVLDSVYLVDL